MRAFGEKLEQVAPDAAEDDKPARPWPFVVKLKTPVEFGKETILEITLRRGRMGDLKGVKLSGEISADALMLVASRISGQPLGVIERLDVDDSGGIFEVVLDFFARSLSSGTKG